MTKLPISCSDVKMDKVIFIDLLHSLVSLYHQRYPLHLFSFASLFFIVVWSVCGLCSAENANSFMLINNDNHIQSTNSLYLFCNHWSKLMRVTIFFFCAWCQYSGTEFIIIVHLLFTVFIFKYLPELRRECRVCNLRIFLSSRYYFLHCTS